MTDYAGKQKKVLLMGPMSTGKTSMRSIIFANFVGRDTQKFTTTISVERSSVRFLANLNLNLWDCGGQMEYIKSYFSTQKKHIFSNCAVLIFVLEVTSKRVDPDLEEFAQCVKNVREFSPEAKLFCLVHKMDLVNKDEREKIFSGIESQLKRKALPSQLTCYQTSIWDETLYKAWASIVHSLLPNSEIIHAHLTEFMNNIEAEEVIIFERATFLDISHVHATQPRTAELCKDVHRHEKISNIVKMFKLSCMKSGTNFKSTHISNSSFKAFIDEFTTNTYIMVVIADPEVHTAATELNIKNARQHFELLIERDI